MNTRFALLVLFAVGCILIAGNARPIFAPRVAPADVAITFDNPAAPSPATSEPLFPGLPSQP